MCIALYVIIFRANILHERVVTGNAVPQSLGVVSDNQRDGISWLYNMEYGIRRHDGIWPSFAKPSIYSINLIQCCSPENRKLIENISSYQFIKLDLSENLLTNHRKWMLAIIYPKLTS